MFSEKIGFIGAGQMGSALAGGIVRSGLVAAEQIWATDAVPAAGELLARQLPGVQIVAEPAAVAKHALVIVLAVKPQQMAAVASAMTGTLTEKHLVISIAAGVTLDRLSAMFGPAARYVRVMPNTPALVGSGASAFALGKKATEADATLVERLFAAVGLAVKVDEKLLDAVTGLSGSGPAFVYVMIEALADGGVLAGLPRPIALELAAQTVLGAAHMVRQTGEHPGVLKDRVASPAGTTIAGLAILEEAGVRGALVRAVEAAAERSRELRDA